MPPCEQDYMRKKSRSCLLLFSRGFCGIFLLQSLTRWDLSGSSSPSSSSSSSPLADALKASAGGLFALCVLYPLDLLRTKRAAEASTSSNEDGDDDEGGAKKMFGKKTVGIANVR